MFRTSASGKFPFSTCATSLLLLFVTSCAQSNPPDQQSVADPSGQIHAGAMPAETQRIQVEGDQIIPWDDVLIVGDEGEPSAAEREIGPAEPRPQTIYLNRHGGTYWGAGYDDPSRNISQLLGAHGYSSVTFLPYAGTDRQWGRVVQEVRKLFSPYQVAVVDQEPSSGDYIECLVSGSRADVMGLGYKILGYSPQHDRCRLLPRAVNFVFAQRITNSPYVIGQVAGHECGHAAGLHHIYDGDDTMSYLFWSNRRFQDRLMQCGASDSEGNWYPYLPCPCGRSSGQNDHQVLLSQFGTGVPGPQPPQPTDPTPPQVRLIGPENGAVLPPNQPMDVIAEVTDQNLQRVELWWDFTSNYLPCPPPGSPTSWTCRKEGDRYTWTLDVGSGDRQFWIRATDAAGNVKVSETRVVHLQTEQDDPNEKFDVTLLSPENTASLRPGESFTVKAEVKSRTSRITKVLMVWAGPGFEKYTYPLVQQNGTDIWLLNTSMSPNARPGARQLAIQAFDALGNSFTTLPITINIVNRS
ncbi:MAG TPA: hypothetical protein VGR35_06820 [Tepidisphaeraceae bacterium]|nr:hypothetical protein [Tepidisphaeraceae bacterium]